MPYYKKKKKNCVPDRWLDYRPVGQRIPGTRFIAFKVPLKPSLNCWVPASESFDLWDLLDSLENQNQELGLIIDLTFTTRYYSLMDVPESWSYIKILTEGRQVPSEVAILSFKRAVRHFLKENQDNDKLIGVHCTHGLNRTGYLVCRYLIDVEGMDPPSAVELFNSCRGHRIERENYLEDLLQGTKRSNSGINEPEEEAAKGFAVERPPQTVSTGEERRPSSDEPAEETQPADETQPPGHRHRHRRGQHRCRADHRPLQAGLLPTPPLLPGPPPLLCSETHQSSCSPAPSFSKDEQTLETQTESVHRSEETAANS
ncbi:RNA/RNP complex-1-interacting phosphatase-like [Trachinotus anak]|uniref:RNA/RNP complex-1-interacting phosphatase-like n=1 Tax=Trachinotus anak TaxID=443729 RepID=UPI0039F175D9